MSVCHNAVDRHVASGKGDSVALVHDSPLTDTVRKITYSELKDQVSALDCTDQMITALHEAIGTCTFRLHTSCPNTLLEYPKDVFYA